MNDDDTQTAAAPKTRKPKTELPYVVGQWLPDGKFKPCDVQPAQSITQYADNPCRPDWPQGAHVQREALFEGQETTKEGDAKMTPICFYHRADYDGVCSAAIVKKFVPDCELYGIDYGDPFPWDKVMDGPQVSAAELEAGRAPRRQSSWSTS